MPLKRHLISAIALASFYTIPLYAIAQTDALAGMPEVMQQNAITYVTGGIGDDERKALEAAKPEYNLHIMNANKQGAFVEDTTLSITDRRGTELLNSEAGPIFLAKLPAGSYVVSETRHDETKKQTIRIASSGKPAHVHFSWKSSQPTA